MADRSEGSDPSGSESGKDLEPLRGGTHEVDRGRMGPKGGAVPPERPVFPGEEHERETSARKEPPRETNEEKDPPAPYHADDVPAGGLAPRAAPGRGTAPQQPTSGELEATAAKKIPRERSEVEREGANAPRSDPTARGAGE